MPVVVTGDVAGAGGGEGAYLDMVRRLKGENSGN